MCDACKDTGIRHVQVTAYPLVKGANGRYIRPPQPVITYETEPCAECEVNHAGQTEESRGMGLEG